MYMIYMIYTHMIYVYILYMTLVDSDTRRGEFLSRSAVCLLGYALSHTLCMHRMAEHIYIYIYIYIYILGRSFTPQAAAPSCARCVRARMRAHTPRVRAYARFPCRVRPPARVGRLAGWGVACLRLFSGCPFTPRCGPAKFRDIYIYVYI